MPPVFHSESELTAVRSLQRTEFKTVGDALQDQVRKDADAHAFFDHCHDGEILPGREANVRVNACLLQQL